MPTPIFNLLTTLQTFAEREAEFIVVGGVCAVLHGASSSTFGLDLVYSRTPKNLDRLLSGLEELDAYFRDEGRNHLRPAHSHLASPGHQLLMTRAGPLDLLGTIGRDRGYDELLPHTIPLKVGQGLSALLLDLTTLIAVMEEMGRDKDKATLAILRRTLEEKGKK